jgi:hypothetical protein
MLHHARHCSLVSGDQQQTNARARPPAVSTMADMSGAPAVSTMADMSGAAAGESDLGRVERRIRKIDDDLNSLEAMQAQHAPPHAPGRVRAVPPLT